MVIGSEGAECFLNEEELIELIFSWKERVSVDEFAHDAADSPNIDFMTIDSSNQELGWTIPSRGDIVGHFVFTFLEFVESGEAEVADFEGIGVTDEQVFGLYVSVDDIETVEVVEAFEDLENDFSDDGKLEAIRGFF